jgi:hypothetical protein
MERSMQTYWRTWNEGTYKSPDANGAPTSISAWESIPEVQRSSTNLRRQERVISAILLVFVSAGGVVAMWAFLGAVVRG